MTVGTGTIVVTVGSQQVIGIGTIFTKELSPASGIVIAQGGQALMIASIIDDTHLTLINPFPGRPGNTYCDLTFQTFNGDFTPNINLPSPGRYSANSAAVLNRAWMILDLEIPSS